MSVKINISKFLKLSLSVSIVDVRTPAEFIKGHIPGAVNIPLFTNEQRAAVGTIYKQKGKLKAVLKGLDYTGPVMRQTLEEGLRVAGDNGELLVHCWRGGMRSENMAWLFSLAGIKCTLLEGGYKSYRKHILSYIGGDRNIIILGGLTGSGKTDILKELREMGEQVIDLEGIANHRGSAFGAIGLPPQPSSEYFVNLLYDEMVLTDTKRRLFLEDESLNIGAVFMPDEIYAKIRKSKVVAVMCDVKTRMPRLLKEYGSMPVELLSESVKRISKRLGGEKSTEALEAIVTGNMERAIEIVLEYYDKSYRYGLSKRDQEKVFMVESQTGDAKLNAELVIQMANKL